MEGVLEEEYRQPMLWEREDTFGDFICQIITIRNDYIDGKTGYSPLWELIRGGVFAFTRPGINWTLRVIINAGTEPLYCPVAVDERILMTSSIDREENTIEKKGYRITLNKK